MFTIGTGYAASVTLAVACGFLATDDMLAALAGIFLMVIIMTATKDLQNQFIMEERMRKIREDYK